MLGDKREWTIPRLQYCARSRCLTVIGGYFILRPPLTQALGCQVLFSAEVAKLADALASGASGGNLMGVQLPPSAPSLS